MASEGTNGAGNGSGAAGAGLAYGPLTGIRVVDMTVAIQGPHAAAYLADMGAEVIKVERTGGELNRYVRGPGFTAPVEVMGTQWVAMNRGKRAIALNVHKDPGREVMLRLIDSADVFVSNYRLDALERMGLSYAELSARNPRLIYARVSGFGPEGPDAAKAMLDGAAQARSGLANISGPADGPPMPPGAAVADHVGSMGLTIGIMTALYARERTGRGQQVDTSSLGAMMWAQAWEITHTAMAEEPLQRAGQHHPSILCPYGVYETKDGGAFLLAVAMSDESWDDFWMFVENPEPLADARWDTAPKRIGARGSMDGVEEIRALVREAFASRTTAEWDEFFAGQPEIIFEKIQSYNDLIHDPQVTANGYLTEVEVPHFGPAKVVTNLVRLSDTPAAGPRSRPPHLGEHTAEVMAELGFSQAEIDEVMAPMERAVKSVIAAVFDNE